MQRPRRARSPARKGAYPVDEANAASCTPPSAKVISTPPSATAIKEPAQSWLFWWPDGVGGISKGGLFGQVAPWVDVKRAPGHTSQVDELSFKKTVYSVVSGRHFFMAPHSTWCAIALLMHVVCPYEGSIAAAKEGWAVGWVMQRFALDLAVALAYYAFFHLGLWHFGWAQRKFLPEVHPTAGNMAHNLWYWFLGIVQWTLWECVMIRLWATGKVPYTSNAELLANPRLLAWNAFWVLLTPCWRDTHFYIVHRFSHVRAIYRYVHSLHHRNTDPEPFSGLCMHPIEHLYYYSNAWTPALYLTLSPFIFLYTFVHLTIAPGAGHSGWEDHFQSDQYHYLHHAKFECNYGSPFSASIDMLCGTFREALGRSTHYSGEWSEKAVAKAEIVESKPERSRKVWSSQSYLGWPATLTDVLYTIFWISLFPFMAWAAVCNHRSHQPTATTSWAYAKWQGAQSGGAHRVETIYGMPVGVFVGIMVAYAPLALATALTRLSGDKASWRWPFHRERLFGTFGIFLFLGWLCCVLPTYHAAKWIAEAY